MKLIWLTAANIDLARQVAHIRNHNPNAAKNQARLIFEAINGLLHFPMMGRPAELEDLRELVVPKTPFIIAYRVRGDEVQILRVLHGKQRWPEI